MSGDGDGDVGGRGVGGGTSSGDGGGSSGPVPYPDIGGGENSSGKISGKEVGDIDASEPTTGDEPGVAGAGITTKPDDIYFATPTNNVLIEGHVNPPNTGLNPPDSSGPGVTPVRVQSAELGDTDTAENGGKNADVEEAEEVEDDQSSLYDPSQKRPGAGPDDDPYDPAGLELDFDTTGSEDPDDAPFDPTEELDMERPIEFDADQEFMEGLHHGDLGDHDAFDLG